MYQLTVQKYMEAYKHTIINELHHPPHYMQGDCW